METQTLKDLFVKFDLEHLYTKLERHFENSISFKTEKSNDADLPIGTSKMGGVPDVPKDFQWPEWNGFKQLFVVQINLNDLASFESAKDLPKSGLLSFFFDSQLEVWGDDPNEHDAWKVFYFNDADQLGRHSNTSFRQEEGEGLLDPCSVTFFEKITPPSYYSEIIQSMGLDEDEHDQYGEMVYEYYRGAEDEIMVHQLFGHPLILQEEEMQSECQRMIHAANPEKKQSNPDQWKLLLQIDSDEKTNVMWGDCGILYFWINEEDLKAQNFKAVWTFAQCH